MEQGPLIQDGVANGNLETVLPVPFRPLTWASCVVLDSDGVSHPSLVHVLTFVPGVLRQLFGGEVVA